MTKQVKKNKNVFKELISDVVENIKEGAVTVGKKTKETAADVYASGTGLMEEANKKIQELSTKQNLEREKSRYEKRQNELLSMFGSETMQHYLKNDSLHKSFLKTSKVDSIVQEYKANIDAMKKIDSEIKKLIKESKS